MGYKIVLIFKSKMFIFLLGIIFALVFINLSKNFLEKYLLVVPSKRRINKNSIPQGGGIFFVLASFFHFNLIGIKLFSAIPLLIVSFLDDLFEISWKLRLSIQVFSSILLISNLPQFLIEFNSLIYFIYPLFILTSTSIINITNFMDGLDGLVGGSMFIVILTICFDLGLNLNFFLGALLGFLILNWAPAKIFMGDIGSNFLGFLFISLIMESKNLENMICYLLLLFPLIIDSTSCLLRRILNEEKYKANFQAS